MNIIQAELHHRRIIQSIAQETWPVTFKDLLSGDQINYMLHMMYSEDALKRQMCDQNHVFLLFKENEKFSGYLSYELNYRQKQKTKIHKLYILPSQQGNGVGKALIHKVMDIAKADGNEVVSLNVNKDNDRAILFYEKMGFMKVGFEDIDIGNGYLMEDAIMDKPLN